MNRLDYYLQKVSLVLLIIATCVVFIYTLSFSTNVLRLSIDRNAQHQSYFKSYETICGSYISDVVSHINDTYDLYMKTNHEIFKLSLLALIGCGILFLIGCYRRKRYTLTQNILTKIVPIMCLVIAVYSLLIIFRLKEVYSQMDYEYYNNFITVIDNEHYKIFPDYLVINYDTSVFHYSIYVYGLLILTSLLMIASSSVKWMKIIAYDKAQKGVELK